MGKQVLISPTFYEQLLHPYSFAKKLQSLEKLFRTKKLLVKGW